MRCVLVGNYGAGNIGDEALRQYFLSAFSEIDWTVVSVLPKDANEVPCLPAGCRSLFRPWWRTIGAFWSADAIVFGGGSLFTDSESVFACLLWGWHAFVALLFRKPIILAFQGVGPFRHAFAAWVARSVFERAIFISVRDELSLQRMASWKCNNRPILTFDPAFAPFSTYTKAQGTKKILGIIPRANADEEFFTVLEKTLREPWDEVRLLLMQPDHELLVMERITRIVPSTILHVEEGRSVDQFLCSLSGVSLLITQRYHGALAGMALGIATTICSQRMGDKLDSLRCVQSSSGKYDDLLHSIQKGENALREAMNGLGQ